MAPVWLTDNMLSTIRRFDRFIGVQSGEACYLLYRLWVGPMISGTMSGFVNNTYYNCYEYTLYTPTVPPSGGKPRLSTLQVYLDGIEMVPVASFNNLSLNSQFCIEIEKSGPKSSATYGAMVVVFNPGFVPTGHVLTYRYERVCHCIETEESFHPLSTCPVCIGTGFVGGYVQYTCEQQVECGRVIRPPNTILVRFPITSETVKVGRYGMELATQRKSWAVVSPLLHDWDMIIRPRAFGAPYNIDPITLNVPSERYSIIEWEHSSTRASYDLPLKSQPYMSAVDKGVTLHQKFNLNEYQPQHIIYQVNYNI